MCSLAIFSLLLVLCATARARPGDNDILQTNGTSQPLIIPVNQKYPSAVLFGKTCGGTIIGPKWILAAAHCNPPLGNKVVAGTNNTSDGSGVSRMVKRVVLHPSFGIISNKDNGFSNNQVAARWDFLLAELSEPLPLDDKTMKAATLDDQPSLPVGLEVGYAGFGSTTIRGFMRSEMHGRELVINETCSTVLEQFESESMLCARGRPPRYQSACKGDSGSGLLDNSGRLVGVLSWFQNDEIMCNFGSLVVFSRVAAVRDWIRQVTNI